MDSFRQITTCRKGRPQRGGGQNMYMSDPACGPQLRRWDMTKVTLPRRMPTYRCGACSKKWKRGGRWRVCPRCGNVGAPERGHVLVAYGS